MRTRGLITIFFWIGTITMLIMSMHYFQSYLTGVAKGKTVSDELWYHIMLRIHILFGFVAMVVAPSQFSKKWRVKSIIWHKRFGYTYVASVFLSSISGLIVAQFAMGGFVSMLGFSVLAVLWFVSTFKGLQLAVKGNFKKHQIWMIRSFALTFSAIPLRLMLLISLFSSVDFMLVYKSAAWLCWIINLSIAELIIRNMKK